MCGSITRIFDISLTAPTLPQPHIRRSHLIQTLTQTFISNTDVVCVEAPSGWGKTTILLEFADTVDPPCFGLFLKAHSRLAYDPVFARYDLANQVNWYLKGKNLPDDSDPTDGDLRNLWGKCARELHRRRKPGYIIVDGFHHIPFADESIRQALLGLLPFGVRPFKFLFSGEMTDVLSGDTKRTLRAKPYLLPLFNAHETSEFLQDLITDDKLRAKFVTAFGGVPAVLASVRRQLASSSEDASEILHNLPTDIESLFDAEWSVVSKSPSEIKRALGFVAAYGHPVKSKILGAHCDITEEFVEKAFRSLTFLTYSQKAAGWEFSSDSFRNFAERRLQSIVDEANEAITEKLLQTPDSNESLTQLPAYLERAGKTDVLVDWLHGRRLAEILLRTRTAARIEPTLRTTIGICHREKRDRALTTYALSRSIIQQASQTTGIEHEIRARSAVGDVDGALAVANDVPLLTQRMRLLAVTVEALSNSPGFNSTPLLEEIREIYQSLDLQTLPSEEAIDIATDLYPIDAELALNLLKEVTQSETEDSSFELALARFTVAALISKTDVATRGGGSTPIPVPKDLVVDEKLRRLLEASEIFFHPKSAVEVLEATESIEDSSERLFIQRKWVARHPLRSDALDVVEFAVHDAISTPQFAPNASFYREISIPLPYALDIERRKNLVAILDGQKAVIRNKGPIVDYVRLQLRLAECNYADGEFVRTADRLEELYLESIYSLDELETRITCLGWFTAKLHKFDPCRQLDQQTQIRELVDEDFEETLTEILQNSAEQFLILKDTIKALAISKPEAALAVSRRLNTIERRTDAFREAVGSMCRAKTTTPRSAVLFKALDEMEVGKEFDGAIRETVKRYFRDAEDDGQSTNELKQLFGRLAKCSSSVIRARCLGEMSVFIGDYSETDDFHNSVDSNLLVEFNSIASPRDKYRTACKLVSTLREKRPDLAKTVFEFLANTSRPVSRSEDVEEGIVKILDLLTKASYALAKSKLLTDDDVTRVCDMTARVPDLRQKVALLSTLAFYLWRAGESHRFSEVVNQQVWPALSNLSGKDCAVAYGAWYIAYPAVWLDDRDRARDGISHFPASVRDDCTNALSRALLEKQPPGEAFDSSNSGAFHLNFSDIQNVLKLSEETDEDFSIFANFECVASEVTARRSTVSLTREQKAEISRRMLEISEQKLPAPNRIQHAGFQILCKAQALRISQPAEFTWEKLIKEGEAISNVADRVYVLAHLAVSLPPQKKRVAERLLKTAESITDGLPTIEDQYSRFFMIAYLSIDGNRHQATRALNKAFEVVVNTGSRESAFRENQVIDLAYRLDSDLPMKLAMVYDDDPAREEYKKRANRQLDRHKLKKDLGESNSHLDLATLRDDPNLASAAWRAVGALNSGRMIPTNMVRLREMLVCASNYPLNTSYSMYSWVLSNALMKYSDTSEARTYIRDLFEGVLRGTDFFFSITEAGGRLGSNPEWQDLGDAHKHFIVQIGESDEAKKFLQTWLEESAVESITIVDPYFGIDDLEFLVQVIEADADLHVQIVTSKAHQLKQNVNSDLPSAYSNAWRRLCEHAPPETEILVVGTEGTGVAPFHDRWILSKGVGLRLGTSLNSLGNKDSEISVLGGEEVSGLEKTVERYLSRQKKEYKGERVRYEMFELVG